VKATGSDIIDLIKKSVTKESKKKDEDKFRKNINDPTNISIKLAKSMSEDTSV